MQQFKCLACGRHFRGGERINNSLLWIEYTSGKQTYQQLADKYSCSLKTIQRRLDNIRPIAVSSFPAHANVIMDTTYFGRNLGVMVFKDSLSGQVLLKRYVNHESLILYENGLEEISRRGIKINAIICDGHKGLLARFSHIPIQMCHFHQVAIIRRYLTKNPKLQASKELWALVLMLAHTDKESFVGALASWNKKWEVFLNERRKDEKGKSHYVHRRLRSACRSLKSNMPWLFTYYDNMNLKIPNTTNALEGLFSDLKNKLRNHNGLSMERKKKFIDEFLKA